MPSSQSPSLTTPRAWNLPEDVFQHHEVQETVRLQLPRLFSSNKGACQDAERSPDWMINRLPDEVLLEVFDFYRQSFGDQYDNQWRKKYARFSLAHVAEGGAQSCSPRIPVWI